MPFFVNLASRQASSFVFRPTRQTWSLSVGALPTIATASTPAQPVTTVVAQQAAPPHVQVPMGTLPKVKR